MAALLELKNLSVSFDAAQGELQAVREVSLTLHPGEVLALVGESGCGKTALCRSVMGLLPANARIKGGSILLNGVDITHYRPRELERLRGRVLSMAFQDPLSALNPTIPVGEQIAEAIPKQERSVRRVVELMELVGIPEPEQRRGWYPHQFSGGMRQRCVLAAALAAAPQILFADEPTTALDVTIQAQILDLLRTFSRTLPTACLLVSHDLGAVARAADRVAVMYAGKIVETGTAEEIFSDPRHPYTQGLLRSLPSLARRGKPLYTIPGMPPPLTRLPPGDAFACRNEHAMQIDYEQMPPMFPVSETHAAATWLLDPRAPTMPPPSGAQATDLPAPPHPRKEELLLDVRGLSCEYCPRRRTVVKALDNLSFRLYRGEIFGLVGESGSGKSTAARCVMNICRPSAGYIRYQGIDICSPREFRLNRKLLQTSRQLIFQDSASSLDGKMTVAELIAEPMKLHRIRPPRGSLRQEAAFQLHYVGLDESCLDQYPAELSGGQRQRVAVARALCMEPDLLVADEPVASLDVSIQAQMMNLFRHLRAEHGVSILFIAHDLSIVRYLCDRVGVLYRGRLVECAPTEALFSAPAHPYTQALLSAVPIPDPARERGRRLLPLVETSLSGTLSEIAPEHFVLKGDAL